MNNTVVTIAMPLPFLWETKNTY